MPALPPQHDEETHNHDRHRAVQRGALGRGRRRQLRRDAGPAAAAGPDLAGPSTCTPSSRTSSSPSEEWERGDRLPHPHRADVHRRAAGVHPALRRARASRCWSRRSTTGPAARPPSPPCSGPFHMVESPRRELGDDIALDGKGDPVPGHRAGSPVRTAHRWPARTVDVWQANEDGFYDVQQPGDPARAATCAGCSPPTPRAGSGSARSCPGTTRSPTTARSAAAGGHRPAPEPARRTCTSSSAAPGLPAGDHARLRRGQPLPGLRRGVRGQGEPDPGRCPRSTTRPRGRPANRSAR